MVRVWSPDGKYGRWYFANGLELHRLVLEDYDQLERRSKELDKKIIDAKCSFADISEVSETTLPLSPPQMTPLWLACANNATNSALLLLSLGADPNIVPRRGNGSARVSPLCYAALYNNPAVCRSLLASGASQDDAGST